MVAFALVLCTAGTLCAQQRSDSDPTSKILALENAWNRASESKDLRGLDNLLDERFLYVDLNGRLMNKAEVLKDVQDSSVHQVVTLSVVVRLHGDTAIVTGLFQMKAIEHGKTLLQNGRFIDTWLRKDGGWVAIGSLTTPTQ
jgi:ketosteroid isomerase-like protein